MRSSARRTILWFLLVVCNAVCIQGQEAAKKSSNISGKITIKGKGAPGIRVVLRPANSSGPLATHPAAQIGTTDQDGIYRITNVLAGSYQVTPAAGAFVISSGTRPRKLIISEGETVEGIDFELLKGGVITGRVSDVEGRPLIEEQIQLLRVDQNYEGDPFYFARTGNTQTDDRGIYRMFGIPPGRYKVAVGISKDHFVSGPTRSQYKQTFHTAASDSAHAKIIDVTEGTEVANVDITLSQTFDTFTVSGRIVDGDSGRPLPSMGLGLRKIIGEQGSSENFDVTTSNSRGEFKIDSLTPGQYALLVVPGHNSELRADAVQFEIRDQNVKDLIIKTSRGVSASGMVVFKGADDSSQIPKLSGMHIYIHSENSEHNVSRGAIVNSDGSFRINGLRPGIAFFSLTGADHRQVAIVRVERDGVVQPRIEIKGEDVSGIRILAAVGNGTIRGLVKVGNGELPATARFHISITSPGNELTGIQRAAGSSPQVDSRGHFLVENLTAGTYEVSATVFLPASRRTPPTAKQQVTVLNGVVTEITITVDVSSHRDTP